jgi:hypothetical protein
LGAALWWAWTGYAWLMNVVDPEAGVVGAVLLVALIAIFVAALVVRACSTTRGSCSAAPYSSSARCIWRSSPSPDAGAPSWSAPYFG